MTVQRFSQAWVVHPTDWVSTGMLRLYFKSMPSSHDSIRELSRISTAHNQMIIRNSSSLQLNMNSQVHLFGKQLSYRCIEGIAWIWQCQVGTKMY